METAKTRVGGWKSVEKDSLPAYYHMRIMERLTFENPAYIGMARHRPQVLAWQIKRGTAPPKHLKFYRQDDKRYYVPRVFDLGLSEEVIEDLRVEVPCELPEPAFPLWDIQQDAITDWEQSGADEGVLVLPTGAGKTILGLEMARRRKQRLLIITNRVETGLDNWVKDCQAYLGFKPGTIQGDKIDFVGCKVVVATFQTLHSKRDLMRELRDEFGMVVVDECVALDTPIATPYGEAAMEDLHVGHKIWSFNFSTQRIEEDVVLAESTKEDDVYEVCIKVKGRIKKIRCSGNHPFFMPDGSEIYAKDLMVGSEVLTSE